MVTFRNNNNIRRNNFRRNDRGFKSNVDRPKYGSNFSKNENFQRKSPGRNNHNASKLIEKYSNLAREALSSGDKILYESFMQHAEHFIRLSENVSNISNDKVNSNETFNQTNISKLKDEDVKKSENLQTKES